MNRPPSYLLRRGAFAALLLARICQPAGAKPEIPVAVMAADDCPACHGHVPQVVEVRREQPASTLKMIGRLEELLREAARNPTQCIFFNTEQAVWYREKMAASPGPKTRLNLQSKLISQLLNSGKSEDALEELTQFETGLTQHAITLDSASRSALTIQWVLCKLRIGEQENCLAAHTSQSCLFPIRGGGVHRLPRGSRGAIEILSKHLREHADDLQSRWLLNIAHMTLGEYPDKVDPAQLIPPRVFESEYDIKRFPQIATEVKLDVNDLAGGSVVEDFDGNGLLDVMVSTWDLRGQLRVFRNNGDATFTERTDEAGVTGLVSGINMKQADYNNDGFTDVFVLRGAWLGAVGRYPNSLLRNNGDGTFTDVTEEVGLLSFHPTQTCT